jgi:primosomal protein N'
MAHGYHRWQITIKTHQVRAALAHCIMPTLTSQRTSGIELIVDVDPI